MSSENKVPSNLNAIAPLAVGDSLMIRLIRTEGGFQTEGYGQQPITFTSYEVSQCPVYNVERVAPARRGVFTEVSWNDARPGDFATNLKTGYTFVVNHSPVIAEPTMRYERITFVDDVFSIGTPK